MTPPTRAVPFAERKAGRDFNTKFTTLVGELLRQSVASRIPPENTQTFYHGRSWKQKSSGGEEISGDVKAHSATTTLRFDTVVESQLDAIATQARSIVEQMQSHFMRTLYETVSNAVEAVGNVVDAKNKPTPEAFLEMLRKIEFGVDRNGNVTRPELHLHPDTLPKFMQSLEEAGPGFKAEVDRVTLMKEEEALSRERARRAKFRQSPSDQ